MNRSSRLELKSIAAAFAVAFMLIACRDNKLEPVKVNVDAAPKSVAFDWIEVGTSIEANISLKNVGQIEAEGLVEISGAHFAVSQRSFSLPPGEALAVSVTYLPGVAGEHIGSLRFVVGNTPVEVPLSGKAYHCEGSALCGTVTFDPDTGKCHYVDHCDDGNACTEDRCDMTGGGCVHEEVTCPEPENECRVAVCDPVSGCSSTPAPNGTACGTSCNAGACQEGTCAPSPCDDGNACTRDSCEPGSGTCSHEDISAECNLASNPCVVASCDEKLGCIETPLADGTSCGVASCQGIPQCLAGACVQSAPPANGCGCNEAPPSMPKLATGGGRACRVRPDRTVECWGALGWRGDGTYGSTPIPVQATGLVDVEGVAVIAGNANIAMTQDAGAYWWDVPEVQPDTTPIEYPVPTKIPYFKEVHAAHNMDNHVIGLSPCIFADGSVWCWGLNNWGEFGDGTRNLTNGYQTTSFQRVPLDDVVAFHGGIGRNCAIREDTTLWCWGANGRGDLGVGRDAGHPVLVPTPARLSDGGILQGVVEVSTGLPTCARTIYGEVLCAGIVYPNELAGQSSPFTSEYFSPVSINGCATQISGSEGYLPMVCMLKNNTEVSCVGWHPYGLLGASDAGTTWDVSGLSGVTELRIADPACAAFEDGGFQCWGWNSVGQLGDGTFSDRWAP